MKLIILLYLFLGVISCGKITGRGVWPHESMALVVSGNILLIALLIIGFVHACRKGRFLGFDRWLWLICTVGAYAAGVVGNTTLSN